MSVSNRPNIFQRLARVFFPAKHNDIQSPDQSPNTKRAPFSITNSPSIPKEQLSTSLKQVDTATRVDSWLDDPRNIVNDHLDLPVAHVDTDQSSGVGHWDSDGHGALQLFLGPTEPPALTVPEVRAPAMAHVHCKLHRYSAEILPQQYPNQALASSTAIYVHQKPTFSLFSRSRRQSLTEKSSASALPSLPISTTVKFRPATSDPQNYSLASTSTRESTNSLIILTEEEVDTSANAARQTRASPTMHTLATIMQKTDEIADPESRRLTEIAYLS